MKIDLIVLSVLISLIITLLVAILLLLLLMMGVWFFIIFGSVGLISVIVYRLLVLFL